MMNRRAFLCGLTLGALATPRGADGQQAAGRLWRVGVLQLQRLRSAAIEGFLKGLTELGYVEGANLIVIHRSAQGHVDRLPELVAELIRLKVDLIASPNTEVIMAAKRLTTSVPLVMTSISDPIGTGLVASFAKPGGNVTGMTLYSSELAGKRLEILAQAVSHVKSVGLLVLRDHPPSVTLVGETEAAARVLGLQLHIVEVRPHHQDVAAAVASTSRRGVGGLIVQQAAPLTEFIRPIADIARHHRLATMHSVREFVEAGGLMAYGPNIFVLGQHAAVYADKILKGAKPADLPIEQPTKFELVINVKTAKALGLTIPPSLLLRADQVIE
jgi:putative ABC transport system substrate-binding protein